QGNVSTTLKSERGGPKPPRPPNDIGPNQRRRPGPFSGRSRGQYGDAPGGSGLSLIPVADPWPWNALPPRSWVLADFEVSATRHFLLHPGNYPLPALLAWHTRGRWGVGYD